MPPIVAHIHVYTNNTNIYIPCLESAISLTHPSIKTNASSYFLVINLINTKYNEDAIDLEAIKQPEECIG